MRQGEAFSGSLMEGITSFFDPNVSLNTGGRKGSRSFSNFQGATMLVPSDNEAMMEEAARWVKEGATEYFDELGKITIEGIKKFYDQSQWPQRVWDAIGQVPPAGTAAGIANQTPTANWRSLIGGLGVGSQGMYNLDWWNQNPQTLFDAFGGQSNAVSQFQSIFGGDGIDSQEFVLLQRLVNAAETTADNTDPSSEIDRANYYSPINTGDFLRVGA